MNNHAKRLCRTLEALDFRRDYDAEQKTSARRVYRHANDPTQALKVFDCMTDNTITAVERKANRIADTGWSGPRQPQTIRERATVRRSKERDRQARDAAARQARADAKQAQYEANVRAAAEARRSREVRDLMMPGYGR